MILFLLFIQSCLCQDINIQQLPNKRNAIGSASLPDAVFFAGGHGGFTPTNVYSNTIDIFDANTNSWKIMSLSSSRFDVAGTSFPDKGIVFFAGGVTENLL